MDTLFPRSTPILVDSSALVYLVEGEPGSPRKAVVDRFFGEAEERGWRIVASTIIWKELLEKPLASGDEELVDRYRRHLSDSSRLELRVVDVAVAERAAKLTASLSSAARRRVSEGDALHIATAIEMRASAVLGNDESWRDVPGCPPLLLVDELAFEFH